MFRSFFLAGFECATGYNAHGQWIDQIEATHHDRHVEEDYDRLRNVNIHAVREAVRWPLVDIRRRYDFRSVEPFVAAADRHGLEVIWDLFHYGFPDDVDLFAKDFPARFADYCRAVAAYIVPRTRGVPYFTPINEPSYFSWAGGEVGRFAPHAKGRGFELKVALARAAILAVDAIRDVCPSARMVNVDPICRVVAPHDRPDLADAAAGFNDDAVHQFWDMLAGTKFPELGGRREYLDIVGINYYWTNQWELGRDGVPLADDDPRRVPLRDLVRDVYHRYGGDLLITETGHVDERRPAWLTELAADAERLLDEGVPLAGVCLYPILGMPEWHERDVWTRMGLWDLVEDESTLRRDMCAPMYDALQRAQALDRHPTRRAPPRAKYAEGARDHALPRTGDAPVRFRGALVFRHQEPEDRYRLSVYRADRGDLVAAVQVATRDALVHHVVTATSVRELGSQLRFHDPGRILRATGLAEERRFGDPALVRSWQRQVGEALVLLDGGLDQAS